MKSQSTKFYRRYWILLILRAVRLAGFGSLRADQFHRLVYFANALMPAIDVQAETARVMKAEYGPFFPDYQWDLDRLIGMNLVSVADIRWVSADRRFFGKYRITDRGNMLAENIASCEISFSEVERAISEIVSAFAVNPSAMSGLASHYDANFGQDILRYGQIIDFGEWQPDNYATNAAGFLFDSWLDTVKQNFTVASTTEASGTTVNGMDGATTTTPEFEQDEEYFDDQLDDVKWMPITDSHPRKRALYFYAHYLHQQVMQNGVVSCERVGA